MDLFDFDEGLFDPSDVDFDGYDVDVQDGDFDVESYVLNDPNTGGVNVNFGGKYDYIDDIYDGEISSAEDKLTKDLERIRDNGAYSWENPEYTLNHDKQRIIELNQLKREAMAEKDLLDSKMEYWDKVSAYCKESMSKKIHGN